VQKTSEFVKIIKYKKSETYNFVKQREITMSVNLINTIWNNLDVEQEKNLGYFPFNNNKFFKTKYLT
jgi:hypothetical protein